jgi:hypothetical protein
MLGSVHPKSLFHFLFLLEKNGWARIFIISPKQAKLFLGIHHGGTALVAIFFHAYGY